jgi:hypothetical protein
MTRLLAALLSALLLVSPAYAGAGTITTKDAGGVTRTFDVVTDGTGNFNPTAIICDGTAAAQCAAVKAASTAAGATDPALVVAISPNNTIAATQSGTWNVTNISGTVSLPTGASTSALQTTGNTALTTINTTLGSPFQAGGSIGNTAFIANAGTNLNTSALATSANLTSGTQKTQIVDGSGNVIGSTSNNLNIQCANCSGSGASATDAATFTAGTSVFAPAGGEYTSGGATACVTGHQCLAALTPTRGLFSDVNTWAETSLGVPTAYGTAPTGNVIGANVFVTNSTASLADNADAIATTSSLANSPVNNYNYTFNGTTFDRVRSGSLIGSIRSAPVPSSTAADALSHASGASAAITSLVAKASAGNLYGYNCTGVAGAAAGFCVAYNGTTAPSTGALTAANVLDYCYFGTTAAGCSLSRIPLAVNYSTGIVILVTSAATPYTYTTGTDTAAITADYD